MFAKVDAAAADDCGFGNGDYKVEVLIVGLVATSKDDVLVGFVHYHTDVGEFDGTGNVKDVTVEAGLNVTFYGMGAATGDFDNDGDVDLYITAVGKNHFFRNDGGVFIDTTSQSGVAGDEAGWSTSAGFFDYDNDGDLDLFVCNYVM